MRCLIKSLMAAALAAAMVSQADAAVEIFTGSTSDKAASATFQELGGGQLQVTLVNTYTNDTPDQAHVLTGLFFSGADGLTPVSATAAAGSLQWLDAVSSTPSAPSVLGTEWAYGMGSAPGGASAGIVSAGFYTPGMGNFAAPGDMLDGSAWGLVSAGYAGAHPDGLTGRTYIQNSMVFVLSGFTGPLNISHVGFQYGTSLSEPCIGGVLVPEPQTWTLAAASVLFVLLPAARRKISGGDRKTV